MLNLFVSKCLISTSFLTKSKIQWDRYLFSFQIWPHFAITIARLPVVWFLTLIRLGFSTLSSLRVEGPPMINPEPVQSWLYSVMAFAWLLYYMRSFEKYQNSNQGHVTFWWRNHISSRSLKLSIFMNKSNFPNIITQAYNNRAYWEGVLRKANVFFKPSGLKYDYYCRGYIRYCNRRYNLVVIKCYIKLAWVGLNPRPLNIDWAMGPWVQSSTGAQ